ncbi:MAG TPA: hypothetical protein VNK51_00065 [Bradyrhizobium sp.]|jgi:hypothetical protein|uniref:hypothetical protein n=1 Tax=Bradyrhizobium sp. CCH5-F6 TaxID=1768753 RepID=UPI000769A7EC|nr:hypothetical protein [Bradyrhizobium sp. CCH5-F6]HXH42223.1 hypothetical protein [Bradyrhizobium sp.]
MIEQVKQLLAEQQFTIAAIVDDAFDDMPRPGDIPKALWDRFFDDLKDADHEKFAATYQEYDAKDPSELSRDPAFLKIAWELRDELKPAGAVFVEFIEVRQNKRDRLVPLQDLLKGGLGLICNTYGRDGHDAIDDANIIFLDLFLGYMEGPGAVDQAIERIKAIVDRRRDCPPTVILLSESPRLHELGPTVRDRAELLGCQFRMVRKSDLGDAETMVERLYELAVSRPDALKLNGFVLSWDKALTGAREKFLASIRTLDLPDYANMNALILEAEEEPVGDYILDLYDLHLHSILEGDTDLVRDAKRLNQIDWKEYPPAQFMPTEESDRMMDGALFQHGDRTRIEAEIDANPKAARLGDVFLAESKAVAAKDGVPEHVEQHAFVVLSQACDLQHGNTDRLLLLKGSVHPYERSAKKIGGSSIQTPIMMVDGKKYSLDWDPLAVETWMVDDLPARLDSGLRRVRRFRTPFALQLQQAFIGRLGRVGTLAAMPTRQRVGVRMFLRGRSGATLLAEATMDQDLATCLAGRDKSKVIEWLLLSEKLLDIFRKELRNVDPNEFLPGSPSPRTLRDDPAFYRKLKAGLAMRSESAKGEKPLKDTPFDIVQIVLGHSILPGSEIPGSFHPIVIEVQKA